MAMLVAVAMAVSWSGGRGLEVHGQAGDGQLVTYELVDTWEEVPRQLRPGYVAKPVDVTSADDGHQYVLDRREDGSYVHVFDRQLNATDVYRLADLSDQVRLDAARDGTFFTLGPAAKASGVPPNCDRFVVEHYDPAGSLLSSFASDIGTPQVYSDIAVSPDGRVYLTRHDLRRDETTVASEIDIFDGIGSLASRIDSEDYYAIEHTDERHLHFKFNRVDVAPNGFVTALVRFESCG